jgi:4-alpha-glucanotransferase
MAADAWGIESGYWDIGGTWHETSPETRRALRVAMGGMAEFDDPPPRSRPVWFVRQGTGPAVERPAEIILEDGTELRITRALPPDLPLGYHGLAPSDGGPLTRLIVTPARCHLPADLHTWGWMLQLYATRSRASWGIGDLGDLRRLGEWSASLGAGVLGINPLHAQLPFPGQDPSPYFPSSRRFVSELYVRLDDVPGFDPGNPELAELAELAVTAASLNEERLIDRDRVWALKRAALERLWQRFDGDPAFDDYCDHQSIDLHRYASFCVLAEEYGARWPEWPAEHRRPDTPAVVRHALAHADRVRFHEWLQWLLDAQMARAGSTIPLLTDLAVGVDPGGADAWMWQDVLAPGVTVGSPPDAFNHRGQDWGFNPFVPWKLRATGYRPVVETLRAAMRHAGGVRVDHVMGLFRLYWIPPGASPSEGAYVRFPASELLDIVALESVRAKAWIAGEDLGTVEDHVRAALSDRGVLSYRLLWFEEGPPEGFPRQSLASCTTHDLPTVAGLWRRSDAEVQRRIGLLVDDEATDAVRRRLMAATGLEDTECGGGDAGVEGGEGEVPVHRVISGACGRLATSPSMVVTATLDDALGVEERPNMPGTIDEYPNWRLALPRPIDDFEDDDDVLALAETMRKGRAASRPVDPPDPARS